MAATITTIKTGLAGASNFQYTGARKIARNSSGHIYIVYWRTDGTKKQVYVSVSTDGGANWNETQLSTDQTKDKTEPSIVIDSNDNVYVAWSYDTNKIQCIKYSGGSWGSIVQVGDITSSMYNVCLALAPDDHIHAICFRGSGYGTIKHSETTNGNASWSNFNNAYSSAIMDLPNEAGFCIDSNGHLHIIFGLSYLKLYYSYSTDDGANWSAATTLSSSSYNSDSPSIAADSAGQVYAVWVENRSSLYCVYFNYTVSGVWQTAAKIAQATYNALNPNIALDKDNHIYVVFRGPNAGSPSYSQITWLVSTNGGSSFSTLTVETTGNYTKYWPHLIWSYNPIKNGARFNRPNEGFMLAYLDSNNYDLKLMVSSDLAWPSAAPIIQTFTDSGTGVDSEKANKADLFLDIGHGDDLFKTIGAILKFIDTGQALDSYALYSLKLFIESVSGSDSFIKIRTVIVVDSVIGVDLLKANKVSIFYDASVGNDKLLTDKLVILADSGLGDDDFLLKAEMLFKDYGVAIEIFKVSYPYPRNLRRKIIIIRAVK